MEKSAQLGRNFALRRQQHQSRNANMYAYRWREAYGIICRAEGAADRAPMVEMMKMACREEAAKCSLVCRYAARARRPALKLIMSIKLRPCLRCCSPGAPWPWRAFARSDACARAEAVRCWGGVRIAKRDI